MKFILRPEVETERLNKLYHLQILNTPEELKFDQITKLVAGICGTESALISLVDKDRIWFKSRFSFEEKEISREIGFCDYALATSELFEVEDTLLDEKISQNPFVINKPNVRFYAAMPLITADNFRVGTLCVLDSKPKKLSEQQKDALKVLASNVINLIESDAKAKELESYLDNPLVEKDLLKKLSESNEYLDLALEGSNLGIWDWNLKDNSVKFSDRWAHLRGEDLKDLKMDLSDWESRVHPEDLPRAYDAINRYLEGHTNYFENVHRVKHKNGRWIYILGRGRFSAWDDDMKPTRFTGTDMDITDLMSNRLKLDLLFRYAPYGFAFCDLNGKFKEINQTFSRITGYTLEELSHLSYWELTPKKYDKDEALQLHNLELKGSYGPYRKEYVNKSGELIPVELNGFMVENYDGEKGIWSIIEDISEKMMAESAIKKVTTQLTNFFELSENYLCLLSSDLRFKKLNPSWPKLGYSFEELISMALFEFIHPEDVDGAYKQFEKLSQGERSITYISRFRKKEGSYIVLEWSVSKDPDTGIIFGSAIDATDRIKREGLNELLSDLRGTYIQLSHEKLKFFEYVLEKVLSVTRSSYGFIGEILEDRTGKYLKTYAVTDISWNKETQDFYDSNSISGLEFRNLNTLFGEVIKTGELLITNDAPNHPKAGGIPKGHPALNRYMGIPISYGGEFFAMIGVANGADEYSLEQYEFFKPLFDMIGGMIHSVRLSSELDFQKRLSLHSAKLASIGELAAGVGHEINNPLAVISGQLEMLKFDLENKHILDNQVELKIAKSLQCVERIARITKGLRSFARSDSHEFSPLNVSDLLNETIDMLFEIYSKESIVLNCDIQKELWIFGNRGRIQQVFVNLLSNAKDALTSVIKKEIKVTASRLRNEIRISISDTGAGVPEKLRQKIFEPFFTTKEVNKGTGIGLALVSSIIVEHKGLVTLDENKKPGACFNITLPSHTAPIIGIQNSVVVEKPKRLQAKGKILIVDDEDDLRESLKQLLEVYGLDVATAKNGKEAFSYFSENYADINLIISDIKMPLMDGPELAKAVKDSNLYTGGFLFITGGINTRFEDYLTLSDGVLIKPFNVAEIMDTVKRWVVLE